MLAQSFLSAAELGLPEAHRDALIKTLVLMETDKLVHLHNDFIGVSGDDDYDLALDYKFSGYFNMSVWQAPADCGTVACIGGTAELISGLEFTPMMTSKLPKLNELFYPQIGSLLGLVTIPQATQALRNYLTTGQANWSDVLEKFA